MRAARAVVALDALLRENLRLAAAAAAGGTPRWRRWQLSAERSIESLTFDRPEIACAMALR
jgi:hypothetical protein